MLINSALHFLSAEVSPNKANVVKPQNQITVRDSPAQNPKHTLMFHLSKYLWRLPTVRWAGWSFSASRFLFMCPRPTTPSTLLNFQPKLGSVHFKEERWHLSLPLTDFFEHPVRISRNLESLRQYGTLDEDWMSFHSTAAGDTGGGVWRACAAVRRSRAYFKVWNGFEVMQLSMSRDYNMFSTFLHFSVLSEPSLPKNES